MRRAPPPTLFCLHALLIALPPGYTNLIYFSTLSPLMDEVSPGVYEGLSGSVVRSLLPRRQ